MSKSIKQLTKETQARHSAAMDAKDYQVLAEDIIPTYNHLLNQAPNDITLLFLLGTAHSQLGNSGLAIHIFRRCIQVQGDNHPEFWNNMGSCYKTEHMIKEARECFEKALALRPNDASYYSNMATLYINEGDPETGLEHSTKSLELDPTSVKNHWNHALLLLEAGHIEEGFIEYDAGLLSADRPNRLYGSVPFYQGEDPYEDLKGKTVVVYGEQGIGDELLFASALPDLLTAVGNGMLVYECHDRLENVMRRSFPGITIKPTRKDSTPPPEIEEVIKPDYRIAIGSLFRFFGVRKRPPYLVAKPELVDHYKRKLREAGPGPYIGIGYAGGTKKTHAHARNTKITPLFPILQAVPCTLVSLQYTDEATEKFNRLHEQSDITVHHWPSTLYSWKTEGEKYPGFDYDYTIALIAALDLVVVPNTAVVHVCGALGKPCYTLTPDKCAWRYRNNGQHMLWYFDHVTLFREDGDMSRAINTVADRIRRDFK